MPDWKTMIVLVALTGGTNVLQYFGVTVPTTTAKSEVTANSDFMRDELNSCLVQLKECYAQCAHTNHFGAAQPMDELFEYEAAIPYPEQLIR